MTLENVKKSCAILGWCIWCSLQRRPCNDSFSCCFLNGESCFPKNTPARVSGSTIQQLIQLSLDHQAFPSWKGLFASLSRKIHLLQSNWPNQTSLQISVQLRMSAFSSLAIIFPVFHNEVYELVEAWPISSYGWTCITTTKQYFFSPLCCS